MRGKWIVLGPALIYHECLSLPFLGDCLAKKCITKFHTFRNYFIIGYRNLLRNKVFSLIYISGLAIGLAACFFIVFYVRFEKSYDRFHTKSDRIYRVNNYRFQGTNSTKMATCNPGTGLAMKAEFPEVIDYARALDQSIFMGGSMVAYR